MILCRLDIDNATQTLMELPGDEVIVSIDGHGTYRTRVKV